MYLFLDDLRNPGDVTWVTLPPVNNWIIVRSYSDAVNYVLEHGYPDFCSFDHDLGDIHDANNEKTGYDFAKFLVDHALDGNTMPVNFSYVVHSMNHIGGRRISALLDNYIQYMRK